MRWERKALPGIALLLTSACTDEAISPSSNPSMLDPHGPAASHLNALWWVMFAFGAAVVLLVVGLLAAALLRNRRATSDTPPDGSGGDTGRKWVIRGGIALPLVILAIVFGYNIYTLAAVVDPRDSPAVKIKVVGHQWWWEVQYPDQEVTTANEIHIPVGVPVQVQLESSDVIHSFWVPELNGKMDLIPTRINYLTLQADQVGVYRGECAEFCGLQHAHMGFMVVAESRDAFNGWVAAQRAPAAQPDSQTARQGQQVFLSAGCAFCHTVRGLDDRAMVRTQVRLGPDLTHVHSRLTIAGASLAMSRGNLAGWVMDAQHLKPRVLMPNMVLKSQDLLNLLAYLETLR